MAFGFFIMPFPMKTHLSVTEFILGSYFRIIKPQFVLTNRAHPMHPGACFASRFRSIAYVVYTPLYTKGISATKNP